MAAEHSLPSVPHLLSLQVLDENSSSPMGCRTDGPNSISFSPTPSFAESFSTAYTSPSQADFENTTSHRTSLSPVPPVGLRKSMSVDSIAPHNREVHSSSHRPTRNPPPGPSQDHDMGSTTPPQGEGLRHKYIGRYRGYSIGSTRDSNTGDPYVVDSDVERSEPLTSSIDRYRHISLKGHDQPRPPIKGGELPLPSRTTTLSSTSSMNSMNSSSTSSSTLESAPRKQSLISLQSFPGQESTPLNVISGRIRSGSLGVYTNAGKRMIVNTQVSTFDAPGPAVAIVVIGVKGCGKSVVIRKGLRGHELSEPSLSLGPSTHGASLTYSRRVGQISRGENTPSCPLHVFEVEVPAESLDPKDSWPDNLSAIDGVIICYDSSDEDSFKPVQSLLRGYRAMKLPIVVLACKSDLPHQIEPERALEVLQQYDVGLVEVAKAQEHGKEKMRRTFGWLMKAVFRDRRTNRSGFDANYRNPASPDVLISPPPWETSRDVTPTASSSILSANHAPPVQEIPSLNTHPTIPPLHIHPSTLPNSPTRARSTGDLLFENEQAKFRPRHGRSDSVPPENDIPNPSHDSEADPARSASEAPNQKREKDKESRPAQWATLDELLDKLLFLAVSGDDPAYITHFLLTYRRFASPRSVLLAMQKRMRQLDNPSGDPMFACFAQMRICHLLELWIRDYPYDFAVKGTAGALAALIKSIISKTYLLHYGSEFLPFLEMLPNLVDRDSVWAWKVDDIGSDDSSSFLEEDSPGTDADSPEVSPVSTRGKGTPSLLVPSRERKPSLPLPTILTSGTSLSAGQTELADTSEKQQIKDLVKLAQEVQNLDPDEIAQEITRVEVKLFLDIQPRHWLNYTFVSGKKDESDPITAFNSVSNHLADWVVSLILCHERPRARVKQIEKFVEIAHRLRALNNYSALRAFVAGINNATFAGDDIMEQFKLKSPEQAKALQSWDVLLQHIRSHRAYRLALRNTKGACIPALEVHMSDLIRAHEGNEDLHPSDPAKIHWGKFNMMGRFITSTAQCQAQCKVATEYNFIDRNAIKELFVKRPVMNDEMQKSRIGSQEMDFDDYRPTPHSIPPQPRDAAILRKLFTW